MSGGESILIDLVHYFTLIVTHNKLEVTDAIRVHGQPAFGVDSLGSVQEFANVDGGGLRGTARA